MFLLTFCSTLVLSLLYTTSIALGADADVINKAVEETFIPLVGIPYVDGGKVTNFSDYINALYFASISIAAFLAVVKIIFSGVKYMLTDVVTSKSDAKSDIKGALLGLLIVVGAVLILNTINPNLKQVNIFANAPVLDIGEFTPYTPNGSPAQPGEYYSGDLDNIVAIRNFMTSCSTGAKIIPGIPKKIYCPPTPQQIADKHCPSGKECHIEPCDANGGGFTCRSQCVERNGTYYDEDTKSCVFTNDPEYTPNAQSITVDPNIQYQRPVTSDEDAAGYEIANLTIIGTESVDGGVLVYDELERFELVISCSRIRPSVCN